jgi:hypothetical protein
MATTPPLPSPLALVAAAALATSLAGCGGGPAPAPTPDPGEAFPTYHRDIAPIVAAQCADCHQEGGIGAFRLRTYEDARPIAGAMKSVTASRTMPPYGVDASGDCNTYQDARWLDDQQIATIAAWADAGAPEGDPADSAGVAFPVPEHLEGPTHELDMGVEYTPDATVDDDYRCFVIDPGLGADGFLTSYEVIPGEPRTVHHVLVFSLQTAEADAQAEQNDAADPGPGYKCFGGPDTGDSQFLAAWAPGTPVTRYPAGTGLPMQAGRKVVLQVHYNLANGPLADRTRLALRVEPSVARQAVLSGMADLDLALPPGLETAMAGMELTVGPDQEATVLGVFPHMHTLGRKLRVERERAGATSCVVDVPSWSFHWQQFYFYDEPLDAKAGDLFRLACEYDTRGRATETTWGEETGDEMCLAGFYFVR